MRFYMFKVGFPTSLFAFFFIASVSAGTLVLEEGFEGAFPPPGWSTVDDSAPSLDCAWRRSDDYTLTGLVADSLGAAADSNHCAPDGTPDGDVDTWLISPELDLTGSSNTILSYQIAYRHFFPSSAATLDISTDGGDNWTTLATYNSSPPVQNFPPEQVVIDLSAYDGEPAVTLRWRYTAGRGWWVFVDNVIVGPAGPGVLEVDPVTLDFGDAHTGILSTMEVSVSNASNPGDDSIELDAIGLTGDAEFQIAGGSCAAGASELDPGDSCTIRVAFTASAVGTFNGELEVSAAGGQSQTVTLTGTGIPTSAIEVAPDELSTTLEIGETDSRTIEISNIGTQALDWEIPLIHGEASSPAGGGSSVGDVLRQGVLLVFNAGRNSLVALDPQTGDLIDPDFVVTADLGFGSKPKSLMHPDGERLLLTHQNVVHAFDSEGDYLGIFAPAGGEDTNIMQNIRGMAFHPETGHLLVASAPFSGAAPHAVVEFDLEGNYLGHFIDFSSGDVSSPWSILFRENDLLLSAGNNIHRFEHDGTHIGQFNSVAMNFVQQVIETENGNILATSSGGGVWEFDATGTHIGNHMQFDFVSGVHELPGGNLLVTANTGLHEIDLQGNVVRDILGGAAAMFSLVKAVDCTVPDWLSIAPISGSIPAGDPADEVVVTFDAAGLDPGVHEDVFCIVSNDPTRPRVQVPVTLTVESPADFAVIEGTVESAGHCSAHPALLAGATVQASGGGEMVTRTTDENGFYRIFLPESASPVDITVSAPGHLSDITAGVPIAGGQTATENFELALDAACITLAQDSYHFEVLLGDDAGNSMTIGNSDGAGSLEWSIGEGPGLAAHVDPRAHFPAQPRHVEHKDGRNVSAGPSPERAQSLPASGFSVPAGFEVPAYSTTGHSGATEYVTLDALAPQSLTVITASQPTRFYAATFIGNDFDNHYMLAAAGGSSTLNTFGSTDTATGNFTPLGTVTGAPAVTIWTSMKWDHSAGTLYATGNSDELYTIDPETLEATLVGRIDGPGVNPGGAVVVAIAISPDGLMYALDLVDDVLLAVDKTNAEAAVIGPVGVDANFAQDMDFDQTTGILYWAAYNSGLSRMYILDTETGAGTPLGDVQGGAELQAFTIAKPGGGCSAPEEISWLSVSEASGTTAAHGSDEVEVTVNTAGLAHGSYEAFLCVASNDPVNSLIWVPVTLDVTDADAGFVEGTVTSAGSCGADPQPLRGATVAVSGVNGVLETITDSGGFYRVAINDGESPVDITVSADGHLDTTVSGVVIEAGVTVTQDIELVLEAPCFTVDPGIIEAQVGPDGVTNRTLVIGNTGGGAELDWTLNMAGRGNQSPAPLGEIQLSQTHDTNMVPEKSPACPVGANHSLRRFYFHEHPGVGDQINSVDVAIQDVGASSVLTVNLYTLPSDTPVDTIPMASLELIGAVAAPVSAADNGTIVNVPVTATVSDIEAFDLVVEVVSSTLFGIGATNTGETHPGFVIAPVCGITEPTRLDQMGGFENVHIILMVNASSGGGCAPPEDVPWLSVAPDAGTTVAGGTSEVTVNFDASGLELGDYEALLCVNSNDPANRRIEVPVTLSVLDQAPPELAVDPDVLDFGAVPAGATAMLSFDVLNIAEAGAASLALAAITATGDAEFSVTGGTCQAGITELQPGQSCTVEVVFAPAGVTGYSAGVTVESADGQQATVALTGQGFEPGDAIFEDRFEK